jgi:zinc transport system substrate-binding protein
MKSLPVALMSLALASAPIAAAQADIRVVASIKPIHSLVSGVMAGVGTPSLIVEGAGSPHTYSLKPSQAKEMQSADVIFWVGHRLETFLEKPLDSLGANAMVIELMDTDGLTQLAVREGGAFEGHDHDHDHGGEDHDDHGHGVEKDDHHDHEDEKHGHSDHDHDHEDEDKHGHSDHDHADDDHKDHAHSGDVDRHDDHEHAAHGEDEVDAHIWLDPMNAKVMVHEIARNLAEADPANAVAYRDNAKAMAARIDVASDKVARMLEPVHDNPFIVFHDAYQHFESRFDLNAVGSITVSPEVVPGAARVEEIRAKIAELGAVCVFSEPQFTPKLVSVVTEGSNAREGVLDPLGAGLTPGADLYVTLIDNLASSVTDCLAARS